MKTNPPFVADTPILINNSLLIKIGVIDFARLAKCVEEGLFVKMSKFLPNYLDSADLSSEYQSTSTDHKPLKFQTYMQTEYSTLEFTLQSSHTLLRITKQT